MKNLYLIRHGKSSWDDLSLDDFERPLSKRGKRDIKIIGEKLKEKNIYPDMVISSSAKRAKKTTEKICEILGYKKSKIIFEKGVYDNHMKGIDFYISLLSGINKKQDNVILVGHNPFLKGIG